MCKAHRAGNVLKGSHYSNVNVRFARFYRSDNKRENRLPHNRRSCDVPNIATRNFLSGVVRMWGVISSNKDACRYHISADFTRHIERFLSMSIRRFREISIACLWPETVPRDQVKYMNQRLRTCRTYGLPQVFVMTWLVRIHDSHCESGGSLNGDRKCRNVRPIRAMLQVESKSSDRNRASARISRY